MWLKSEISFWLIWSTIKIFVLNQLYYSYKMCLNHISTGKETSWRDSLLPNKNCIRVEGIVCSEGKLWSTVSGTVINDLELCRNRGPRHCANVHSLLLWSNIWISFVWVSLATASRLLSFWISWWSILAGRTARSRILLAWFLLWRTH